MLWLLFLFIMWLLCLLIADGYDLRVADDRVRITVPLLFASLGVGVMYLLLFFVFARPALFIDDLSGHSPALFDLKPPPRLIPVLWLSIGLLLLVIWRLIYIQLFHPPSSR